MTAIKIHRHLDSETIHLPELRPLIGKDVSITVTEENPKAPTSLGEALDSFDHMPVDPEAIRQLREDSKI